MGKFTDLVNENLEKKVKNMAIEMGVKSLGINVEVCGLKKSKKDVGVVLKGNDMVERFTNDPSLVLIALYERAFEKVDEQTQDFWIRNLLSQISYDLEKDKISINKPELNISLGMYRQFGEIAIKKTELALLTIQQIIDEDKELKMGKKGKKNKQNNEN